MANVLQEWVTDLTIMQQTVLLTAIRGPDGVAKYHPVKFLLRWYRRCVLLSALDKRVLNTPWEEGGGSFTGPSGDLVNWYHSYENLQLYLEKTIRDYLRSLDELPHHFQMHLLHAVQILGYKHPDLDNRKFWRHFYERLVNDLHLYPESEEEMDKRLGDNRANWLARNDAATVE